MKIKNKKAQGMLGEHAVELIIAVLCIVALIFLGYLLWSFFSTSQELNKAKAGIDVVYGNIQDLSKRGDSREFLLQGPENWHLMFYSVRDILPMPCEVGKSCVCICKKDNYDSCNNPKTGVCKVVGNWIILGNQEDLGVYSKFKISVETSYEIKLEAV